MYLALSSELLWAPSVSPIFSLLSLSAGDEARAAAAASEETLAAALQDLKVSQVHLALSCPLGLL